MDMIERWRMLSAVPWRMYLCEAVVQWLWLWVVMGFAGVVVVIIYHGCAGDEFIATSELVTVLFWIGMGSITIKALDLSATGVSALRRQLSRRKAFMTMEVVEPDQFTDVGKPYDHIDWHLGDHT